MSTKEPLVLDNLKSGKSLWIGFLALIIIGLFNKFFVDPLALLMGITPDLINFSDISQSQLWSALLLAPIIEELVFRNHLKLDKKQFYTAALIPLAVSMVFNLSSWVIIISIIVGILILVFSNKLISFLREDIWYKILFVVTALMFSFMHFPAIENDNLYSRVLIVLLAFFPLACLLGFIRIKVGLAAAMVAHSMANLLTMLLNQF